LKYYNTKHFGSFSVNNNDESVNISSDINICGKLYAVYIEFAEIDTYLEKISDCVKILDEYPELNKSGKKEIIKHYKQNEKFKEYIDKILLNYYGNQIREFPIEKKFNLYKLLDKINIEFVLEKFDPPDVTFCNDSKNIVTILHYYILNYKNEKIILELDGKLNLLNLVFENQN
jgi:hypothetical protein